jgi:hypothetical protein
MHIFHRWGKWQEIDRGVVTAITKVNRVLFGDPRVVGMYIRLRRECAVCGLVEIKDAETPRL